MKILLAADDGPFTQKALEFLVGHPELMAPDSVLVVLNVQPPVPPPVSRMLGSADIHAYYEEEAAEVLDPVKAYLDTKNVAYKCSWVTGHASDMIIQQAHAVGASMIVLGTHGRGWLGRALMGSVAQRVVSDSEIPVLLVK